MESLKPYPAYKPSGAEWLGEVPEHWKILPNRAIFKEINEVGHSDKQMLSVTISRGVIRQAELLGDTTKKDQSRIDKATYKLVQAGDIAYNKMRAWQGAIGISKHEGIISPAYIMQRPGNHVSARYFHYLFRTPAFAKEAERCSYGITSDMWSLRPEHFKTMLSSVPPRQEQTAITHFLDHTDQHIQRQIRAKEKLIALLEEQKQVIIHDAVTGRIDVRTGKPYPAYKPSGVEWLGDMPEHWEVRKLKWFLRCRSGDGISTEDVSSIKTIEKSFPVIGGNGIMGFCNSTNCNRKTLVIGRVGALCGNVHIVKPPVWITDNALVVSVNLAVVSLEYLAAILKIRNLNELADKTAQPLITGTRIKREYISLPGSPEQIVIVDYINNTNVRIDKAITRTRKEIELLKEYRTRLIADVVTGKLDVRAAAHRLPDESEALCMTNKTAGIQ